MEKILIVDDSLLQATQNKRKALTGNFRSPIIGNGTFNRQSGPHDSNPKNEVER